MNSGKKIRTSKKIPLLQNKPQVLEKVGVLFSWLSFIFLFEFIRLRKQVGQGHRYLQREQKEQASIAGRGLANWRWGKPVFDAQLSLPLTGAPGIEGSIEAAG